MSATPELGGLQLLTFRIDSVRMGVDTAQVCEMMEPADAHGRGIDAVPFHEHIPFREKAIAYLSPRVLLIRDRGPMRGIVIDRPDRIVDIHLDSIRPLPDLLSRSRKSPAIWGVALSDEGLIVLVDFYKLPLA